MRISPEPPRVAQAPFRPLYSDLTAPAAMLAPTSRRLRAGREMNCQDSSWQAGDRRSAHFNLARRLLTQSSRSGTHGASRGAEVWGKLQAFVTGCELDDVLAQTGGNTGPRTGLQRARSSHRCFGTCAPHGARARDVHGLPCRMSDVARVMRANCQSLGGHASATQSRRHDRDRTATLRREGRL